MNRSVCWMFIVFVLFSGCTTLEQRRMEKTASLEATEIWFRYLDKGDYEKLWEISSDLRKLKTDKNDFIRIVRGIRQPLGDMIERDLQLNLDGTLVKHYPDGDYRKIVYWSRYENRKFVKEYFLLVKEEDRWAVLRYDFF